MKLRSVALLATALGLMGCSKTTTVENSTTNAVILNDSVDVPNGSDNATDLSAGNAAANSL